jgi:hypothetical protein
MASDAKGASRDGVKHEVGEPVISLFLAAALSVLLTPPVPPQGGYLLL